MCTIILFYKIFDDSPVIVASNRDELYSRGSSPPMVLARDPLIAGGQDLEAGGTWMGVNQHGIWVGIANRLSDAPIDPERRSRGLLCMDLLSKSSSGDSLLDLKKIEEGQYNPFYLIIADKKRGYFAGYEKEVEVMSLPAGVHVMTNHGLNAAADFRRQRILKQLKNTSDLRRPPSFEELKEITKDHGESRTDNLCIHEERGGTRSGTILYLRKEFCTSEYYFADGPPCRTDYKDHSSLLHP